MSKRSFEINCYNKILTYFIFFWLMMYSLRNVMLGCITQPLNYSTGSRDNILKYGSSTTHIQVNIPRRNRSYSKNISSILFKYI